MRKCDYFTMCATRVHAHLYALAGDGERRTCCAIARWALVTMALTSEDSSMRERQFGSGGCRLYAVYVGASA